MRNYFFVKILILLILLKTPDVSASPFMVISAGDPALEDLRFLAAQSGKSFLSFTPPLSRDEVFLILEDIDADHLTPAGQKAYNRVLDALNPKTLFSAGLFSAGLSVSAEFQARARTNSALPWYQDEADVPAILKIPLNLFFADAVQLAVEPIFALAQEYADKSGTFFDANIPLSVPQTDFSLPRRAFIAAGGKWWNFELGRDQVSFGLGRTGNMAVSNTPYFYDMARLSLFASFLKYSLFVSQTPLRLSEEIPPSSQTDELRSVTQRYLYVHRLDARFFKKVSIGLTEGIMVGNSPVELRFLNPLNIFHSFYAWADYDPWKDPDPKNPDHYMVGSMFSVDLQWAVVPSLSLYGQFVMNQLTTDYEAEGGSIEDLPPNGTGFLAGVEFSHDFAGWASVSFAEFMYSDPYLYMLSSPFASYIWTRRLRYEPPRYRYIGHPEGRDALFFALGSRLSKDKLSFSLDFSFARKGEHATSLWDWAQGKGYTDLHTPSGTPENRFSLALGAEWKLFSRFSHIALSAQIAGFYFSNHRHISGKQAYGLDATFGVKVFY
jgi:hypothetical protein